MVMCRSNPKDIDVTVQTLRRDTRFAVRGDVFHLHERQRSAPEVQDRQDTASLRRSERERMARSSTRILPRMRTSGCSATRFGTRASKGVERIEFGAEDGSRGDIDYFVRIFQSRIGGRRRPSGMAGYGR